MDEKTTPTSTRAENASGLTVSESVDPSGRGTGREGALSSIARRVAALDSGTIPTVVIEGDSRTVILRACDGLTVGVFRDEPKK